MEWNSLFEISLSKFKIGEKVSKTCEKFARIVQGVKDVDREDGSQFTYSINRLELKSCIEKQASISIALSNNEFQWLLKCIEYKFENAIYTANPKKVYFFNKIHDKGFTVSTFDESMRVFGIMLTEEDIKALKENGNVLEFLLKYQKASATELTEICEELFISILAENAEKRFGVTCNACTTGSGEHGNQCQEFRQIGFKEYNTKYKFVDNLLGLHEVNSQYLNALETLMSNLNISDQDSLHIIQFVVPGLGKESSDIARKLEFYYYLQTGLAFTLKKVLDFIKIYRK